MIKASEPYIFQIRLSIVLIAYSFYMPELRFHTYLLKPISPEADKK